MTSITSVLKNRTALYVTAVLGAMLALSMSFGVAQAQTATSSDPLLGSGSRLRNMIILDQMFGGGSTSFNLNGTVNTGVLGGTNNLGNLIVLDELFSGRTSASASDNTTATGDVLGSGRLGDLIVLDRVFGGGTGVIGSNVLSTSRQTVVVQSGDTLRGIAARFLGNANLATTIAAQNGIVNPNLIFPGEVLVLPSVTVNGTTSIGTGVLGGGTNNLGNLMILDELFNRR